MKNHCALNPVLFPGLLLALGVLFLCVPAATDAREVEPPRSALPTPQRNLRRSSPQDGLAPTRWISPDGRGPITFARWSAQQPPPPPLYVQQVYASPASAASGPVACVLVNPGIFLDIDKQGPRPRFTTDILIFEKIHFLKCKVFFLRFNHLASGKDQDKQHGKREVSISV